MHELYQGVRAINSKTWDGRAVTLLTGFVRILTPRVTRPSGRGGRHAFPRKSLKSAWQMPLKRAGLSWNPYWIL